MSRFDRAVQADTAQVFALVTGSVYCHWLRENGYTEWLFLQDDGSIRA